jgi:hypothetical protein
MSTLTAQNIVDSWRTQLKDYFDHVKDIASGSGWSGTYSSTDITEDPFGIGARLTYAAPVLILERSKHDIDESQRITFEPRHRNTIGSAGRIDVYSYPAMNEAMLLRIPDTKGTNVLTQEAAEQLVADTPWTAFSQERMPLYADLSSDQGMRRFLEDLVTMR